MQDGRGRDGEPGARVAAIDIGSNTLLMLIAEKGEDGRLRAVRDECRFGRLSQGLDRTGRLADEAVARSLDILREYRAALDEAGVASVAAVGTQALREAANAEAFLGPAREILGVAVEVIAGEREAELVFRSVVEAFPELAGEPVVVADVGGASTEIIVGRGSEVTSLVSVPIGSVRLSERHLRGDPPTADEARALIADIDAALARVEGLPSGVPLVATAGTATTLATVEQRLRTYDAARVQGLRLSRSEVERLLARFLELTLAERRRLPGLEPQRADVIAGGAAILARLGRRLDTPAVIISDRGVRWGLALEGLARV